MLTGLLAFWAKVTSGWAGYMLTAVGAMTVTAGSVALLSNSDVVTGVQVSASPLPFGFVAPNVVEVIKGLYAAQADRPAVAALAAAPVGGAAPIELPSLIGQAAQKIAAVSTKIIQEAQQDQASMAKLQQVTNETQSFKQSTDAKLVLEPPKQNPSGPGGGSNLAAGPASGPLPALVSGTNSVALVVSTPAPQATAAPAATVPPATTAVVASPIAVVTSEATAPAVTAVASTVPSVVATQVATEAATVAPTVAVTAAPTLVPPTPAPPAPTATPIPLAISNTNSGVAFISPPGYFSPGNSISRPMTITNSSLPGGPSATYTLTVQCSTGCTSPLWTDTTNGLQLTVSRGSFTWSGPVSSASNVVIRDNSGNPVVLAPGQSDTLSITVAFPSTAGNSFQGASVILALVWTATS